MSNSIVNLTERNRDYSVFLPSISTFYSRIISKQQSTGTHIDTSRIPSNFENGVEGCNFLNKDQGYYTYKWGLYSAGHAQLNLNKADTDDAMIQKRDRNNTFILGDSGGFQILKGVIQCDWDNFKTDDSLRKTIINWLEHTADYSMILDIPTLAVDPVYSKRTGITSFDQCLEYTKYNNDWFVKNRQGKTKYLNVMQGRNMDEAMSWYDSMKHYPFEGFAFGGDTKKNLEIALTMLIKMRDEKLLDERNLLHYLGTSKLEWGVACTAIKRALRESVNPNIEVTFDCASPFIATAKGQVYTQHIHKNNRFGYVMEFAVDDKKLSKSTIPFPWGSPIAERLNMGDVCYYAPGMLNKIGKEGKTSWDSFSYFLLMSHNVYQHIESVQRANSLVDTAITRMYTNHKDWRPVKNKNNTETLDAWVPRDTIYIVNFIHDLFKSETPMQMIKEASEMLASFSGIKRTLTTETFNNLFDIEETDQELIEEFTDDDQENAESYFETINN